MLPAHIHKHVRQIHIRSKRLVDGAFSGEYLSIFKGRGMEFAEVREYVPGDDVRTIDWNVTARMNQPFVKQHIEERELTVMLLVDLSASGQFGSINQFKTEIAAELSAVLALSALRNNDKVGLILFSDRIEKFVPPQKGKQRALRVIREILSFQPQGRGTDVGMALEYLFKVIQQRSVSFVISDFIAPDFRRPLRIAHRYHEVVPVCISDPLEAALPKLGLLNVHDLETGATITIDTHNKRIRQRYQARQLEIVDKRRQMFRSLGIEPVEVVTDQPYLPPLLKYFRQRNRGY